MKVLRLVNRRSGLATNSSSTHSVIYKNKGEVFEDLNIFDNRYYDRCTETIAASREAKIRYIFGNIFWNSELVKLLAERYPEMKQYYPMVKDYHEKYNDGRWNTLEELDEIEKYNFGDHGRGHLYNSNDIFLSYEALCNIIDSPDLVIVGGSDELDFVYETMEGHDEYKFSDFRYMKSITEKVKNGNYYIVYGQVWGQKDKARLAVEDGRLCPEAPELVDMKITNACEHGCPFCYMNSTKDGEHADIQTIRGIIAGFKRKTEFAIGGGNVLLHPQFADIVKHIKDNMRLNHIVNITIRHDDIHRINDKQYLEEAIINYVDGIGISVQKAEDLAIVEPFAKKMIKEYDKHVSIHIIPELLGFEKSQEILKEIHNCNCRINGASEDKAPHQIKGYSGMKALFLGLKQVGRASKMNPCKFNDEQLHSMINSCHFQYCVDTAFINTYADFYKECYHGDEELFLTRHEGEFSMYIDAVTAKGYKSSYDTTKGYPIEMSAFYEDKKIIEKVFAQIRKDNGFSVYEPKREYWQ